MKELNLQGEYVVDFLWIAKSLRFLCNLIIPKIFFLFFPVRIIFLIFEQVKTIMDINSIPYSWKSIPILRTFTLLKHRSGNTEWRNGRSQSKEKPKQQNFISPQLPVQFQGLTVLKKVLSFLSILHSKSLTVRSIASWNCLSIYDDTWISLKFNRL